MDRTPKSGEFYRHFKNRIYQIVAVAEHTETGEDMVVYQALYGDFKVYTRPLSMFISEVNRDKYPDAAQKYRFEQVIAHPSGEGIQEIWNSETLWTDEEPTGQPNPYLLQFLEADTYEAKLGILAAMKGKVKQEELDSIYTVMDIPPSHGTVDYQLSLVEKYLKMQKQYDGSRLR